MDIHYIMFEGEPLPDNPEKEECTGAYINCWVQAADADTALTKARDLIGREGWKVLKTEEQSIAEREMYEEDPEFREFLEAFNEAVEHGISAVFYLWEEE